MESIEKVCDIKYTLLRKKKKVTSIKMYEPKFEALGQKREVSRKKRDLDKLKKKLHGNFINFLKVAVRKKTDIYYKASCLKNCQWVKFDLLFQYYRISGL